MKITIGILLFIAMLSGSRLQAQINPANVHIEGQLKGLPEGIIVLSGSNYLGTDALAPIDSTIVRKEQFEFNLPKNSLPYFLTIELHQASGHKLVFSFPTNMVINGQPWRDLYFMRDDSISIKGNLKDYIPDDFKLPAGVRLVYPDSPIQAGQQTWVLYNVMANFQRPQSPSMTETLAAAIKKYPYSYYILYELNKNRANFSQEQLHRLIPLFDSALQKTEVFLQLEKSLGLRTSSQIVSTVLINQKGQEQTIEPKKAKVTMVVLWEALSIQCMQENVLLQDIYQRYAKDSRFSIVSVCIDEKKQYWQMALEREKLPWLQLYLPPKSQPFKKEIFQYDGTTPLVLFLDNAGRILGKTSGPSANIKKYQQMIDQFLQDKPIAK